MGRNWGLGVEIQTIVELVYAHARTQTARESKTSAQLQETIVTKSHLVDKGHIRWLALLKSLPGDSPDPWSPSDIKYCYLPQEAVALCL